MHKCTLIWNAKAGLDFFTTNFFQVVYDAHIWNELLASVFPTKEFRTLQKHGHFFNSSYSRLDIVGAHVRCDRIHLAHLHSYSIKKCM